MILIPLTDNVLRRMRNPEKVLNALYAHSKDQNYRFERLYRILFNEEMFFVAYQRIYAKPGNMTPGSDGITIDQMSIPRIEGLIETLKDESYKPHPARRVYIPKKNGKKRPLGIPSFEDKLVQEVVRMVLEAVYEGSFESTSHGFRPYRSCHTALIDTQKRFTGARWFIEGDIRGFFDNINHQVLIDILRKRISDERFIRLIRKFLNAGYIENWKFNHTYSGTPQGGIISPILANIYLDQFDKYMKEYIQSFNKGDCRRGNPEYARLNTQTVKFRRRYRAENDPSVKTEMLGTLKAMQEALRSTPRKIQIDETYRRIQYVRYADDFLLGVIGTKADCERIKEDITKYMHDTLRLELSAEKTLITHATDRAKFLGYDITIPKSTALKRNRDGVLKKEFVGKVRLLLPSEVVKNKLLIYDAVSFKEENGKIVWKPKAREKMVGMKPEDILAQYNLEIRGFYNYYCIANNVAHACSSFGYIMEYSLYMTLGQKLNRHVSQIKTKYQRGKQFVIPYTDSKGNEHMRILYDGGFRRLSGTKFENCDNIASTMYVPNPSLVERLREQRCELCGAEGPLVMHHVRKLSLLKEDSPWARRMRITKRKTLAVCESCNAKIQANEK